MTTIDELTVIQASHELQAGQISSEELIRFYLKRIEAVEEKLHAFITLSSESAIKEAQNADQRRLTARKNAEPVSPLLGIPLAIKDLLCVKGMRCTCGSKILKNFIPPYSATSIARLQSAGMIVIGKTNTDEFGMGSSTENSAYSITHNPWNLDCVPGGSSGGSAAAVAARMIPAAIGTDTGGSVRQPASFCGITGIKPTYGRISRYGLVAYGSSLDCVGVLGFDAADIALIFQTMAGKDSLDATSMDIPVPEITFPLEADLSGIKIGVPEEYFIEGIQPEVRTAVQTAINQLHELGAEILSVSLPHTEYALPVYYLIAPAEASANLARYDGVRYGAREAVNSIHEMFYKTRGKHFGSEVKRRIMLGTYALSAGYYDAYYGQAQKVRTLIKRDFESTFTQVDMIAAPVAPTTAFRIGQHGDDPLAMYLEDIFTLPANLAGIPGLTFPVGFDHNGLPIGMQLMGPHFQENVLFKTAYAYQQITDWHKRKPGI
jgi:aspartyl-tRNA(Asn)/glutamyl-tRNA(Gln) amidotransferase subunit A